MSDKFPPRELYGAARTLIDASELQMRSVELPKMVATGKNLINLRMTPDAIKMIEIAHTVFKARLLLWIFFIVSFVVAWRFGWMWLIATAIIILLERKAASFERGNWKFVVSMLLCYDILAHDFAGWGSAYPEAMKRAREALRGPNGQFTSEWLDYFLPRRSDVSSEIIRGVGPQQK